jgi:hypothetical protein
MVVSVQLDNKAERVKNGFLDARASSFVDVGGFLEAVGRVRDVGPAFTKTGQSVVIFEMEPTKSGVVIRFDGEPGFDISRGRNKGRESDQSLSVGDLVLVGGRWRSPVMLVGTVGAKADYLLRPRDMFALSGVSSETAFLGFLQERERKAEVAELQMARFFRADVAKGETRSKAFLDSVRAFEIQHPDFDRRLLERSIRMLARDVGVSGEESVKYLYRDRANELVRRPVSMDRSAENSWI